MIIEQTKRLRGFYTLQVVNASGKVVRQLGPFDNLITNTGLDYVGNPPLFAVYGGSGHSIMGFCYLGTGTAIPAYTDTKLGVYGAANSIYGTTSYTTTYVAGPPPYWQYVSTYTFAAGVATGTWSEIGIGSVAPSPGVSNEPPPPYLFSHSLIVDGGGSPTTISVLSSEQLVVTYTVQLYFNTTDVTYTPFMVNATSTSGTLRPARITSPNVTFPSAGAGNTISSFLFSGSLGPITGDPTGTAAASTSSSVASYTPGSYFRSLTYSWVGAGTVGTWPCVETGSSMGTFQFTMSPSVVISAGVTFALTINVQWTRY